MGGAVPDLDWRDPGAIPCNVKRDGEQCLVVLCVPLQKSKGGQSLAILKGSHTPAVAEVQRTAGTLARLGSPVQPSGVCHGNSHDDCLSSRSLLQKRSSSYMFGRTTRTCMGSDSCRHQTTLACRHPCLPPGHPARPPMSRFFVLSKPSLLKAFLLCVPAAQVHRAQLTSLSKRL